MKLFLKLIVIAAIINGAYRVGMAEYRFSQLKDSTHSLLVLGTTTSVEQLKPKVLTKAQELGIPLAPERLTMNREGVRTTVSLAYQEDVEVFPGYRYARVYSLTDEIAAIR